MQETLDYVYKEIMSLWKAYKQQPFFGIDSEALAKAGSESMAAQHILSQEEDVEILDAESRGDVIAAYFADANKVGHAFPLPSYKKCVSSVSHTWSFNARSCGNVIATYFADANKSFTYLEQQGRSLHETLRQKGEDAEVKLCCALSLLLACKHESRVRRGSGMCKAYGGQSRRGSRVVGSEQWAVDPGQLHTGVHTTGVGGYCKPTLNQD
eukprot:1162064-Pelagomonas_calceolata.AAC.11